MSADELRRHPAVGVTRKLAEGYAHQVGGQLPSEAQWEFAARSRGKNQLYVWGNDAPVNKKANIQKTIVEAIETLPAGHSTDDRTEQGVLDMAGNVREWCRDEWRIYRKVEPEVDPNEGQGSDDPNALYVIRGGSYDAPREAARTTWRHDLDKKEYRAKNDHYDFDLGFRVVLEILEVPERLIAHSEAKTRPAGERGE
jgi:serine/threonine-protein kinase